IPKKVHESPAAITWVLATLALLSTVAGVLFGFSRHLIGEHGEPLLEEWLHPVLQHASVKFADPGLQVELGLMALSVGLAIGAWAIARARYGASRATTWAADEQRLPGFVLLNNKYYVDEIYQATIIRAVLALRIVLSEMDRWIVDGLVNAAGVAARGAAWVGSAIDTYFVD